MKAEEMKKKKEKRNTCIERAIADHVMSGLSETLHLHEIADCENKRLNRAECSAAASVRSRLGEWINFRADKRENESKNAGDSAR